ncbi:MAG TPA: EF-P lysine aminoacylase GenX [Planctomycetaceae bacterium]|nr:EF-P lysine aminoacylase GenX [Planctomycetaceae bacterium]
MANLSHLRRRATLLRQIRSYFDEQGFLEVQTPCLSSDSIADRFIDPLMVVDAGLPGSIMRATTPSIARPPMMLHTSPELAMKRLLSLGMEAIYQIGPVFRRGDRGAFHNVEFTMLEWYRVGDTYESGMRFLSDFVEAVLGRGPAEERCFGQLFECETGIDPHAAETGRLKRCASKRGLAYPESFPDVEGSTDPTDVEPWIDFLFAELIQPYLGGESPVLVRDYPVWQHQMANIDGGVARRFELFVDGMELANGYDELNDPAELRRRNRAVNAMRTAAGRIPLPQEHFLKAMDECGLPPCCGCAFGVDRLLMILCGARTIDEVIAFPIEEA